MSKIFKLKQSLIYKKEFKSQLKLFLPFLLGQLCACAMGTVDMFMSGLAGTIDISGVAIACSFYWPAYMFLSGFAYGITPTTSHLLARGDLKGLNSAFFNAIVLCALLGIMVAIMLALSPLVYNFIDADPNMTRVSTYYLYFVSISLPFTVIYNAYRSFSEGLSITKPTIIFGILSLALNIPLNYIFIFGHFGMPKLGGIGCGATSCFINILCCFLIIIYMHKSKLYHQYISAKERFNLTKDKVKAYLKLSLPIGVTRTLEVSCFSLAAVILSPLGPQIVAAHSITLNVSSLIFMIPLCVSMTSTIRTASALGINSLAKAHIALKVSFFINFSLFVVYGLTLLSLRESIALIYSHDEVVIKLAASLMLFNVFYLFPDSIQCLFTGVLQGFKDTKIIMLNTIFSYWFVGIPLGTSLAYGLFTLPKLEAYGIWIGFLTSLCICSFVYVLRTRYVFKKFKLNLNA